MQSSHVGAAPDARSPITYDETTLRVGIHSQPAAAAPRPRTEFIHKIIRRRKNRRASRHKATEIGAAGS